MLLEIIAGKNLKDAIKIEKVDVERIEEKVSKIIKGRPGLSTNAYMGLVMKELKGKVSGKEVMEIIKNRL